MRRKKSDKIIERLRVAKYHCRRMDTALCCWALERNKLSYDDEQKKKMHAASIRLDEAKRLVEEVYAEMIGKQIVSEL